MDFQCFHPSSSQPGYSSEHDPVNTPTHSDSSCPQRLGTAMLCIERPEEQIRTELVGLYSTLQRAERYQKYREKQPILTPTEVMERDIADKKEREIQEAENISQNPKDGTVWPDFLEYAFWKALVRWPPMGRRKYMLEGVLKGRNELIQDSIYRDTGIVRDRKQISSHLQVLKAHLKDYPLALAYMGITEESPKRLRGSVTYQPCYPPHLHSPQHFGGTVSAADSGCIASSYAWPHPDSAYMDSSFDAGSYTMHPSYEGVLSTEQFPAARLLDSQASMQSELDFDIPAYEGFSGQATTNAGLQTLSSFDNQECIHQEVTMGQAGCPIHVHGTEQAACYSTRPDLQHSSLVPHLTTMAEQYQTYGAHDQVPHGHTTFHGIYDEQAAQCEGLAESGVFNTQRDVNRSVWDSRDVHHPF